MRISLLGRLVATAFFLFSASFVQAAGVSDYLLQQILDAVQRNTVGTVQGAKEMDETLQRQADAFSAALKKEMNEQEYVNAMRDYDDPSYHACAVGTMVRGQQIPGQIDTDLDQLLMRVNSDQDAGTVVQDAKAMMISCNLGVAARRWPRLGCPDEARYRDGDTSLNIAVFTNVCIPYNPNALQTAMPRLSKKGNVLSSSDPSYEAALAVHAIQMNIGFYRPFPRDDELSSNTSIEATGAFITAVNRINAGNNAVLDAFEYNRCWTASERPRCMEGQEQRHQLIREQFPAFQDFPPSGYCDSQYIINLGAIAEVKKDLQQARAANRDGQRNTEVILLQTRLDRLMDNLTIPYREASAVASGRGQMTADLGETGKGVQTTSRKEMQELLGAMRELTSALREHQQSLPRLKEARFHAKPAPATPKAAQEGRLLEPQDALRALGITVTEKLDIKK